MNGIKQVAIIGATGLREDMTVNNIMLLYRYFEKIVLKIITDHFTIFCNNGKNSFPSFKGQIVSLIPQNSNCEMYTTNLKYALHGNVNNYTNLSSNELNVFYISLKKVNKTMIYLFLTVFCIDRETG